MSNSEPIMIARQTAHRGPSGFLKNLLLAFWISAVAVNAGMTGYLNNKCLAIQLRHLTNCSPTLARLTSLAKTPRSNDLWLVEIGCGELDQRRTRPAMLLASGIEGNDLAGCATAVAWLQSLAAGGSTNPEIARLLSQNTVYVLPRLNPDAAEAFFTSPKAETTANLEPVDEDHDGCLDEDGPEDLNGDGLITWMRIQDPEGEFILDPAEPRLLVKADKSKGEAGSWRYLVEGIDNDKDNAWNEDGPGGVNFNRNFPFDYKYFAPDSGIHQVSETETRALADFVVEHPNIGVVFTFGSADNLQQTPAAESDSQSPEDSSSPSSRSRKPLAKIHKDDLPYYREIGKAWRDTIGLSKELKGNSEPGTFSDWMYFHRGRLSLAARAWSPAMHLELGKAAPTNNQDKTSPSPAAEHSSTTPPAPNKNKDKDDDRNAEDRAFLKWIDENAPELFVQWQANDHADFPGKKVEIGGFAPYSKIHPPGKLLCELTEKQCKFLTMLAGKLPRIGIRKIDVKHLGQSIFEVTVQIQNSGYLPTALAHGVVSGEVYPTRVILDIDDKCMLSGSRITMLGAIDGCGGMKETRYILQAENCATINVKVVSMLGGIAESVINLQETK